MNKLMTCPRETARFFPPILARRSMFPKALPHGTLRVNKLFYSTLEKSLTYSCTASGILAFYFIRFNFRLALDILQCFFSFLSWEVVIAKH